MFACTPATNYNSILVVWRKEMEQKLERKTRKENTANQNVAYIFHEVPVEDVIIFISLAIE